MGFLRREAGGVSGALLAHAALGLWLMRVGPLPNARLQLEEVTRPVDVELESVPVPQPEPEAPLAPTETATTTTTSSPALARTSPAGGGPTTAVIESAPAGSGVPAPEQPFVFNPTVNPSLANEALGVGGRNPFLGNVPDVGGTPAPSAPAPEANVAPGIQKSLHDALAAKDHELGLDTGGPLVAIAEEATRPSDAPENSRAVFEVTIDANGDVTGIRVVDASQGRPQWDRVASRMGATLRSRRIPLRAKGKGIVVTLEVRSRFTLPSGSSNGVDLKPYADGTSAGGQVGFDLSDIGQHAKRDVHARVLSERQQ